MQSENCRNTIKLKKNIENKLAKSLVRNWARLQWRRQLKYNPQKLHYYSLNEAMIEAWLHHLYLFQIIPVRGISCVLKLLP
jgi:hypothetical protein